MVTGAQKPYGDSFLSSEEYAGMPSSHQAFRPVTGACQLVEDILCISGIPLTLLFPTDSLRERSRVFKRQQVSFPKQRHISKGRFNIK